MEKLAKENMAIEKWGQILLRNSQVCQVSALISYIVVYDINGFRFSFDLIQCCIKESCFGYIESFHFEASSRLKQLIYHGSLYEFKAMDLYMSRFRDGCRIVRSYPLLYCIVLFNKLLLLFLFSSKHPLKTTLFVQKEDFCLTSKWR